MSYEQTSREARNQERMSDFDYKTETHIMEAYFRAEAAFRDAIANVNKLSMFATIDAAALEDFAHDYLPDPDSWRATIETEYRE
jgi:hypothetical protein